MEFFVALISLAISIGVACVFGVVTKNISSSKGYDGGFAWGFWLGVIGIIVVAVRPDISQQTTYQSRYSADGYRMSSSGEGSGYAPRSVKPQGWKCVCGSQNPSSYDFCLACRRSRASATEERVNCPHCGASNKKSNASCFACGQSMTAAPAAVPAPAAPAAVPAPAAQPAPVQHEEKDFSEVLRKLAQLHEQGILTDEEFAQKKADVLAKL